MRRWNEGEGSATYLAFFGDGAHGGRERARRKAEAYSIEHGNGRRPRSSLPLGLTIVKDRRTKRPKSIRARLKVGGVRYQRDFAIGSSRRKAIQKAVKARRKFEQKYQNRNPS